MDLIYYTIYFAKVNRECWMISNRSKFFIPVMILDEKRTSILYIRSYYNYHGIRIVFDHPSGIRTKTMDPN